MEEWRFSITWLRWPTATHRLTFIHEPGAADGRWKEETTSSDAQPMRPRNVRTHTFRWKIVWTQHYFVKLACFLVRSFVRSTDRSIHRAETHQRGRRRALLQEASSWTTWLGRITVMPHCCSQPLYVRKTKVVLLSRITCDWCRAFVGNCLSS